MEDPNKALPENDDETWRGEFLSSLYDGILSTMATDQLLIHLLEKYSVQYEGAGKQHANKWLQDQFGWLGKHHRRDNVISLQDHGQMASFTARLKEMIQARFPGDEPIQSLHISVTNAVQTNLTEIVVNHPQTDKPDPDSEVEELRRIKDILTDVALDALISMSQGDRYRLVVIKFIREKHGSVKVTARTLHTLKKNIKQEAKDYLYLFLGNNPKAKQIVDEVFRSPRKSVRRDEPSYGGPISTKRDNDDSY